MKLHLEAMPLRRLTYFEAPAEDTPVSIWREAEVLRPGVYRGYTFTDQDILDLCAGFPDGGGVPLQLEHSMSLERYHGKVEALKLAYDGLVPMAIALVNVLGAWAVERVLDGRFQALSAGIYPNPCRMDELSFVRRGACPTARLLSEEDFEMNEDEKDEGMGVEAETKEVESEEAAVKEVAAPAEEATEEATAEEAASAEDVDKKEDEDEESSSVQLSEVSELERYKILLAEAESKIEMAEAEREVALLLSEGYTTPALADKVKKVYLSMERGHRDELLDLLRSHTKLWEPGRASKVKLESPPGDTSDQLERLRKLAGIRR